MLHIFDHCPEHYLSLPYPDYEMDSSADGEKYLHKQFASLGAFPQMSCVPGNNLSTQVHRKEPESSIGCILHLSDAEDSLSLTQNNEKLHVSMAI